MRNNKYSLYMLVLIFLMPIVVSTIMYFYRDHLHFKTTNHGNLVNPVVAFKDDFPIDTRHWKIIYAPKLCYGEQYENITFTLHQLRKVLGENEKRVNLALLVTQQCQLHDAHGFQKIELSSKVMSQLQAALANTDVLDKIYLVDPMGNLFMYYPAKVNAMYILKDIKKVLEVSQIG
jgi:hypothetical protein